MAAPKSMAVGVEAGHTGLTGGGEGGQAGQKGALVGATVVGRDLAS